MLSSIIRNFLKTIAGIFIKGAAMDDKIKEVTFWDYCNSCVHKDVYEGEDPCNECLTQSWNENSKKPIKFEKAKLG